MISDKNINSSSLRICLSLFSLQKCTIKQLLDSFFCDILNNQGLGKCYQPRPSARLITLTLTFIIHENHKNLIKQLFNIDKKKDSRRRQSLAVLAAMEKMGEKKTATQQTYSYVLSSYWGHFFDSRCGKSRRQLYIDRGKYVFKRKRF